jgi:uncharacterized protein (DUF305 family)
MLHRHRFSSTWFPSTWALLCGLLAATPIVAGHAAGTMPMSSPAHPASPADEAMMSGMKSMQQAMNHAPTNGDPDHDFVSMMTPHHQAAIDMAQVELRYGSDPELRRLAREIIAAQNREIVQMNAWMSRHPSRAR